jgi:dienelactone hydrolase
VPERTETIWGTLKFPANASDKNVPVVVIMHGSGGIGIWEENWMNVFNDMGLATFMVDSNWARRNCKKEFKKTMTRWCEDVHRGMTRIIDGYGALEVISKHPRIDPKRIGCLGISLGARGCLYLNVKRFQKMWGTPGLEFAASVPMYPPCHVIFKDDDEITDTPIRIHVGDQDTYFPVDSCINYVERLNAKGKDVKIKVYPDAHHGFEAKIGGKKSMKIKGHNDGRCYYGL